MICDGEATERSDACLLGTRSLAECRAPLVVAYTQTPGVGTTDVFTLLLALKEGKDSRCTQMNLGK